jgi:energy-coupling factor transporter ATP-binding protein EcfA2
MAKISVADVPVTPYEGDGGASPIYRDNAGKNNPDKLGTGQYARALAKFAVECDTPLTIGVQGEWGSGKTSLLNMMKEDIHHEEVSLQGSKTGLKGHEAFEVIWINTWEHSLLKSPEGCLISIVEEIIDHISQVDGGMHTAQRAKNALSALAKGAVKVGAGMTMGLKGAEVAEDLLSSSSNVVKDLRKALEEIVNNVVGRKQNPVRRFIVFIDDLDRLEPPVAVQVLELLKNIFNVPNCVFVLAIDYQVVVKGLADKFGKPTPENEWEFRAFFDKIIQLPFMMPMGKYDLSNYITSMLVSDIEYFPKGNQRALQAEHLAALVKLTLGHNPRSMKRLLNSLSLIKLTEQIKPKSNKSDGNMFAADIDLSLRKLVFALVCFQISYPKVYELLLMNPDFTNWDDEFVNKVTGGPHEENKELNDALNKVMQVHEEQFDEDWEKALFKIVWVRKWQRSRLAETSKALGLIRDHMLVNKTDEEQKQALEQALKMTAVTAVSSTEDTVLSSGTSEGNDDIQGRLAYWRKFSTLMKGSGTVFDTQVQLIKGTHSSGSLKRKGKDVFEDLVQFAFTTSSSSPYKVESCGGPVSETLALFEHWRDNKETIESAIGGSVKFRIDPQATRQELLVMPPSEVPGRIALDKIGREKDRDTVFDCYKTKIGQLEAVLRDLGAPSTAKPIDQEQTYV